MRRFNIAMVLCLISFSLLGCSGNTAEIPDSKAETVSEVQEETEKAEETADESTPVNKDVFAMDTFMSLRAYGANAENGLDKAVQRIMSLEDILSVTSGKSDVRQINNASGEPVSVSDDTLNIINKAVQIGNETNGALDITVYPVLREWGFTTGEYKIPDSETLAELLENVDYTKINIDGNNVSLPDNFQLDLGALAKGYTSDEIVRILKENGVASGIVSLGGNVQSLGVKPDGSKWNVAVADPFSNESNMCIIEIGEKAVITSGNYERYFIGDDGEAYWHIIDSADGYPADNGLVSVTVIGDSGLECDALSTALFVAGLDKSVEYWKNHSDIDLILVSDDKKIYYTEGISDIFKNMSEMPAEVIQLD